MRWARSMPGVPTLAAQTALASADAEVATAQVHVFKALGGGWEDALPVPFPRE